MKENLTLSEIFRNFEKHLQAISLESANFQRIFFRKCLTDSWYPTSRSFDFPQRYHPIFCTVFIAPNEQGLLQGWNSLLVQPGTAAH